MLLYRLLKTVQVLSRTFNIDYSDFLLRLVLAVALASSHKNTTFELKKINDNRTAFGLYLISILKVNNKRPMGHIAHRSNDNYFNQ